MEVSSIPIAASSKITKIPHEEVRYPSLLPEIINDIFSRLPAKFVLQMECLSKHYSSSLSKDPYFVEAHFRQSCRLRPSLIVRKPNGVVSLIRSNGDKITVEKVALPPNLKNSEIVASCNGIVLVVVGRGCSLWNPATVKFIDLPRRSLLSNVVSWGFGYCNQSHDYKIVTIAMSTCKRPEKKLSAEVICVNKNRAWRSVDLSGFEICDIGSGMSLNGIVYWKPARLELAGCLWVLKDERDVNMDSWMLHIYLNFTDVLRPIGFLNDHQLLLQGMWQQEIDEDLEQEDQSRYGCYLFDFDTNVVNQIPDLFAYQWEEAHYNFTESLVA